MSPFPYLFGQRRESAARSAEPAGEADPLSARWGRPALSQGRFPAVKAGACSLLLGLVVFGAGTAGRAQDNPMIPPLGMEPEEILSNALAVASEMLQPGGLVATNAPATTNLTTNTVQRPVVAPSGVGSPDNSRRENRSSDTDRDSRRRSYRQSYDTVRSRDTFPGNDRSATNAPARPSAAPVRLDYSAFSIVADRNIFNPNRSPSRRSDGPTVKPKQIDSFALVGTMSYEKGAFAFFDGSSASFRKALKAADSIGGCKITEIGANSVKLAAGPKVIELRVGAQLRREDEGEWRVSSQPMTYAAAASSSSSNSTSGSSSSPASASPAAASASSGSESDVLKRMMQRREQE